MILGHSVAATENKATFALDAKVASLLLARETTFPISLDGLSLLFFGLFLLNLFTI